MVAKQSCFIVLGVITFEIVWDPQRFFRVQNGKKVSEDEGGTGMYGSKI